MIEDQDRPPSPEEIREFYGYEVGPDGWRLVDPGARPPYRPGLCRMCRKFTEMAGGWCAGCLFFGPGNPHGLHPRAEQLRGPEQERIPDVALSRERRRRELVTRLRQAIHRLGPES
jgi:hypothetical protein